MAIVAMADAVPGAIASSAEYNKHKTNIIDLDTRLIASESSIVTLQGNQGTRGAQSDIYTELTSAKSRLTVLEGAGAGGLGYVIDAIKTTNSANFTVTETILHTVTFTAVATKRYRFTVSTGYDVSSSSTLQWKVSWIAGGTFTVAGSTRVFERTLRTPMSGSFDQFSTVCYTAANLPSGSVTVGFTCLNPDGATTKANGSATNPTYLLVERIS